MWKNGNIYMSLTKLLILQYVGLLLHNGGLILLGLRVTLKQAVISEILLY